MVDSFDSNYVFETFDRFDRQVKKAAKRHFLTLGKESFLIGLILLAVVFYFSFVFQILPIWVVPFFAGFGLILSIMQIMRQTHALALVGFILNLSAMIIALIMLL